MNHRVGTKLVTGFLFSCVIAACGARRDAAPDPKVANGTPPPVEASTIPAVTKAVASNTTSLDALAPPETDDGTKARRSIAMTDSRGTIDPSSSALRQLPAQGDTPASTGADAAVRSVPTNVPAGNMTKSQLEAPLRDRASFAHCAIPYGTHGEIAAVVYNGAATGVDVKTTPNDKALNFCIERTVRQMTWLKELAVNKVKVSF
jgi:hypothetical protein